MKKLLLAIILFISAEATFSQYYTFTQLNQPYNDIFTGTVISTPGWDYLDIFEIPFPFQFKYFGVEFDTLYVAGGYGSFVALGSGSFGDNQLFFYDAPIMDPGAGLGAISYLVSGSAPNRIVQMQIENAGFMYDQTFSDFMDVQVWFYETTNVIEIHNGPNSVLNNNSWYTGYSGPTIALLRDTSTFIHLYGPASNASSSTTYVGDFVTGAPPENSVYRFSPVTTGIDNIHELAITVFPNPSNGSIIINAASVKMNTVLEVFSMQGQLMKSSVLAPGISHLTLDYPPGIYLLKIISEEGQYLQRLVINR